MKVRHNYICVEPLDLDGHTTEAGVIVTEQVTEERFGKIVAVGPKCAPDVQPGMILMYEKLAGWAVKYDGVEYLFIMEEHALAVMDDFTL